MIDRVPPDWEALRAAVEEACGPTLIVGGALRDLDNGRPIKDLDLFVQLSPLDLQVIRSNGPGDATHMAANLRAKVPGLEIMGEINPSYVRYMRDEVVFVFTCRVPGIPYDVQVILADLQTPYHAVTRCDFGLCQIGWNGKAIVRTGEYYLDQQAGKFTLYHAPSESHRLRSRKRYERFEAEKYPDWGFEDRSVIGDLAEF